MTTTTSSKQAKQTKQQAEQSKRENFMSFLFQVDVSGCFYDCLELFVDGLHHEKLSA